ncbi:MAG: hypothetical protein EOO10_17705 [Chitinophagaceae bacterium]|nr:MAG: hypothetical protein EOO10_17705 [Chitinophagaceae bacterium]
MDKIAFGRLIRRGQLFRTQKEIREALSWKVGYRREMYSASSISRAFDHLLEDGMIKEPEQSTLGFLITICHYDYYQNPENFKTTTKERRTGTRTKTQTKSGQTEESHCQQGFDCIRQYANENANNEGTKSRVQLINNNENNEITITYSEEQKRSFQKFQAWIAANCPSVAKMKEPFTIDQFIRLKNKLDWKKIADICEQMENWEPLLKKRTNAYKTFNTFYKKAETAKQY